MLVYRKSVAEAMLNLNPDDVLFSVSKLFFAYGFGNSLAFPLVTGAAALLLPQRPGAGEVAELVRRHGVTVMFWVPSGYAAMLQGDLSRGFGRLRLAISAGEALPPDISPRIQAALNVPLLNQLGSTEAGHAYCGTQADEDPASSIGRPLPAYHLEVRDKHGNPVTDGQSGELWVKGPTLPNAYLNNTSRSETVFVDGWFRSGDCASRLPNGRFRLLGRIDDMEMVGGIKISPMVVESVLCNHPQVRDVAVTTVVEDGRSQLVAYLDCTGSVADMVGELRGQAREQLAPYMVPRRFIQVNQLPRTINGKLRRHVVRSAQWREQASMDPVPTSERQLSEEAHQV